MFGRKKMYKKGLADAMHAYEAFGEKQEAALAYMRKEVQAGNKKLEDAIGDAVASLEGNIQGLYDHLSSREKAALYQISTPMDIKDLPDEEKRYLLAILYQLADDEGIMNITKDQQAYIRSVQRYLEITNPQTIADLTAVDNIDSIDMQKAFLQVVLEFLYLQESDTLSNSQEEFVSSFSVSKKQAELIEIRVSQLYNAMGAQGLAEKYGFVVEDDDKGEKALSNLDSIDIQSEGVDNVTMTRGKDDITASLADSIFNHLFSPIGGIGSCIETDNYIVFSDGGGASAFRSLLGIPSDIYAVSKNDGSKRCLIPVDAYPKKKCYNLNRWLHHQDTIFAYFADSSPTDVVVYMIDVPSGAITQTNISVHPYDSVTTNGSYYVYSESPQGQLCCIDIRRKAKTYLSHKDHSHNDRACSDKALYFTDYDAQPNQLIEYTFETKDERIISELPDRYGNTAMSYYGNKVFLLSNEESGQQIGYIDLTSKKYYYIDRNINIATLIKKANGWIFTTKDKGFPIKFFNFEKSELITLADGCGYKVFQKGGFFEKDSWENIYNKFVVIGNWVYFQQGESRKNIVKVSIDQPQEIRLVEISDKNPLSDLE